MTSVRAARLCKPLFAAATLTLACSSHAALEARYLNGDTLVDAYYDTALDITWMADADTPTPSAVGVKSGGHNGADLDALSELSFFGLSGWRAPKLLDPACQSLPLSTACASPNAGTSELSHLWMSTLGNEGGEWAGANTGPFRRVIATDVLQVGSLLGSEFWLQGQVGQFTVDTSTPSVQGDLITFKTYLSHNLLRSDELFLRESPQYSLQRIWLVRDGDVTAVPEPGTVGLMGLGLLGVWASTRRRR